MRWVLGLLALAGCTLDYGKDQAVSPDQIPQLVFKDLHQTGVRDEKVLYVMDGKKAEVYLSKKQMLLKHFRFQEYDSLGHQASQGEADEAVIDSTTNNATVTGKLTARSEEQKVRLTVDGGSAGGLTWVNEDRLLATKPQTSVILEKDDGSKIEAQALTLDLGTNKMQLEGNIRGSWVPETKNDATTQPLPGSPAPSPGPSPLAGH